MAMYGRTYAMDVVNHVVHAFHSTSRRHLIIIMIISCIKQVQTGLRVVAWGHGACLSDVAEDSWMALLAEG